MRYAVVREYDFEVRNVIEFDGGVEWMTPVGYFLVPSETLNIMDTYIGEE